MLISASYAIQRSLHHCMLSSSADAYTIASATHQASRALHLVLKQVISAWRSGGRVHKATARQVSQQNVEHRSAQTTPTAVPRQACRMRVRAPAISASQILVNASQHFRRKGDAKRADHAMHSASSTQQTPVPAFKLCSPAAVVEEQGTACRLLCHCQNSLITTGNNVILTHLQAHTWRCRRQDDSLRVL